MPFSRWLLKHGAHVNHAMSTGWTAGHAASKKGNVEILRLLLEAGADKHIRAMHKEFGKNLTFSDVTVDERVLELIEKYP